MNKIKIFAFVIIAFLLLAFFCFYCGFPEEGKDVQFGFIELSSKKIESKLYIKKLIWGMTSDNCLITISNSNQKENVPDENKNYIYRGLSPFLYKIYSDTLTIYTIKESKIPKDFTTKFKIIQIELENSEMMELIQNERYKELRLIKVY